MSVATHDVVTAMTEALADNSELDARLATIAHVGSSDVESDEVGRGETPFQAFEAFERWR